MTVGMLVVTVVFLFGVVLLLNGFSDRRRPRCRACRADLRGSDTYQFTACPSCRRPMPDETRVVFRRWRGVISGLGACLVLGAGSILALGWIDSTTSFRFDRVRSMSSLVRSLADPSVNAEIRRRYEAGLLSADDVRALMKASAAVIASGEFLDPLVAFVVQDLLQSGLVAPPERASLIEAMVDGVSIEAQTRVRRGSFVAVRIVPTWGNGPRPTVALQPTDVRVDGQAVAWGASTGLPAQTDRRVGPTSRMFYVYVDGDFPPGPHAIEVDTEIGLFGRELTIAEQSSVHGWGDAMGRRQETLTATFTVVSADKPLVPLVGDAATEAAVREASSIGPLTIDPTTGRAELSFILDGPDDILLSYTMTIEGAGPARGWSIMRPGNIGSAGGRTRQMGFQFDSIPTTDRVTVKLAPAMPRIEHLHFGPEFEKLKRLTRPLVFEDVPVEFVADDD